MKRYTFYGCDDENDYGYGCGYRSIQNVFIYFNKEYPSFKEIAEKCGIKYSDKLEFASHEMIKTIIGGDKDFRCNEYHIRNLDEFNKINFPYNSISVLIHDGAIFCLIHEEDKIVIIDPHVYTKHVLIPSFSYENGGIGVIDVKHLLTRNMYIYERGDADDFIEDAYILNIIV